MIIGIDGNEANIENRVGVNQYVFELLWGLYKLQDEWKNTHQVIVYLYKHPLPDMPKESEYFRYRVISGKGAWIIRKLIPDLYLNKVRPDIFFSPNHYVPPFIPMPRVCSIMDLGYLKFSGQFNLYDYWQLKLWSAYSINISKAIIAISNSTKEDIVRHYPSASNKTFITYLAFDKNKFNLEITNQDVRRIKSKYSIVGDYILFLSTLKPSKNVEGLLEAFSFICNRKQNISLVIAGKKGWLYDSIFKKVQQLKISDKVIFTDFVSEEDKPGLIKGAKLFCLTSFWEGFGLDILNAMACGIPVVVSKTGSIPEVAGQSGIYVDPYKPENIASGINKILSMSNIEYNKLCRLCVAQASKFSWEKTARETLKILESVK